MMLLSLSIVSLFINYANAAYCGQSSIPYSFEILPDGQPILGCARPVCFGWDVLTGERATEDASFFSMHNHSDGFVRDTILRRQPATNMEPRTMPRLTSICSHNYNEKCNAGQWAAGVLPVLNASASPLAIQCCTYGPLEDTEDRGIASVHPGQIVIGGEGQTDDDFQYFDYIANINKKIDENGEVSYDVDMRRMACYDYLNREPNIQNVEPEPQPQPQPQPQQPPQQFQQPPQQFQQPPPQQVFQPPPPQPVAQPPASAWTPVYIPDYYCFTDDTTVRVIDGTIKRMDELKLDEWVQVVSEGKSAYARVIYWQHKVPTQDAHFQKISLANGDELKLTKKHFIYKTTCEFEGQQVEFKSLNETAVFAENVNEGDCLYHIPKNGNPVVTRVSQVEIVQQKGIYSPMTSVGNIVVNGVYASCNTIIESNTLQSTFFSYVDYFNNLYTKIFVSSDEVRELPIGLETWVAMAEYVLPKNLMMY